MRAATSTATARLQRYLTRDSIQPSNIYRMYVMSRAYSTECGVCLTTKIKRMKLRRRIAMFVTWLPIYVRDMHCIEANMECGFRWKLMESSLERFCLESHRVRLCEGERKENAESSLYVYGCEQEEGGSTSAQNCVVFHHQIRIAGLTYMRCSRRLRTTCPLFMEVKSN